MIHDLNDKILYFLKDHKDLFNNTVFSFDDGLYSVYYYFKDFQLIFPNNKKLICVSTNIIYDSNSNQIIDINSSDAHMMAFDGELKAYMNLSQIKELSIQPNVTICGHGHNHLHAKYLKSYNIKDFYFKWIDDFKLMLQWFKNNEYPFTIFCTPYNEYNSLLITKAKQLVNFNIIGQERVAIEKIMKDYENGWIEE
jgi:hypothetical protein